MSEKGGEATCQNEKKIHFFLNQKLIIFNEFQFRHRLMFDIILNHKAHIILFHTKIIS